MQSLLHPETDFTVCACACVCGQQHARVFCEGLCARRTVFSLALSSCSFSILVNALDIIKTMYFPWVVRYTNSFSAVGPHFVKSFSHECIFCRASHDSFSRFTLLFNERLLGMKALYCPLVYTLK